MVHRTFSMESSIDFVFLAVQILFCLSIDINHRYRCYQASLFLVPCQP
jgi:hypothetical protein